MAASAKTLQNTIPTHHFTHHLPWAASKEALGYATTAFRTLPGCSGFAAPADHASVEPERSVESGDWTQSAFAVRKTQGTAIPSSHVVASSFVLGLPRAEDDQAHHPVPSLGAAEKALQIESWILTAANFRKHQGQH